MPNNGQSTKAVIVEAAWKLFFEKGFDNTTVDDIIAESETSKGSFYHYFSAKDNLLSALSDLFDNKYKEIMQGLPSETNSYDKLIYLNKALFDMIETSVSLELLAYLYSSQVVTKGKRHLLDQNRYYYSLLNEIVAEGQIRGQIVATVPTHEIVRVYALLERALLYDWCISDGKNSLVQDGTRLFSLFLKEYRTGSQ